jgi:crossover junction endodeoxyribonuclease RuvC
MRFLGIDPGLRLTGYGCIEPCAGGCGHSIIEAGVFRLIKRSPRAASAATSEVARVIASGEDDLQLDDLAGGARIAPLDHGVLDIDDPFARARVTTRSVSDRLVELDHDFRELLSRVRPDVVAIEGLFSHYKHPATAIVMGHARGVLLLAVRQAGLALVEIKPAEVKKSLTGFGQSGKGQMQRAIAAEFGLAQPPSPPDVADALAIALCAARRRTLV